MIVKMKFLSISGPRTDIDRVCDVYLSKYAMQLENAITELRTTDNLLPFVEVNPYKEPLARTEQFVSILEGGGYDVDRTLSKEDMLALVRDINSSYVDLQEKKELLKKKKDLLTEKFSVLEPFGSMKLELQKVLHYKYMQVRFGRMAVDYYQRLGKYLYDDLDAVFIEAAQNDNYVYGCYFAANADVGKADSIFRSLHFERIRIPMEYIGTPQEACTNLQNDIKETTKRIEDAKEKIKKLMTDHAPQLLGTQKRLQELANNFDVRRSAARISNDEQEDNYILCGWMSEENVEKFLKETKNDDKVFIMVEEDREKFFGEPPTELKNPKLFKPFEMFIRMYGLPAHNEMDPTIFVALTYTFIFGAMFGDVGQGLCLFAGGGLLYLTKKMNLAGIISVAGLFSTFFGFMFGSIFGFEDVIEAHWLRPTEAMTNLPFIGQLNTVFVIAIAFGMGLNILVMIFQIINAVRARDTGNIWFSHNGIAGLVFYGFLIATIVLFMTGHKMPGNIMLVLFLGVPVLLFLFKEPLTNLVERNHKKMEESLSLIHI